MHASTTYKEVRHRIKLEAECLIEATDGKSQSTVAFAQGKPKVMNNKSAMGKALSKNQVLSKVNEGATKKKKYRRPKKVGKVNKSKATITMKN